MAELTDYLIVGGFGVLIGVMELITRYRDAPGWVLRSVPGSVYLLLNALAPVCALGLIKAFNLTFGTDPKSNASASHWTILFVAGFGSAAFFRSSVFTVRVGNEDVGIGPSPILRAILDAIDRSVDRLRGSERDREVTAIMAQVSFEKARITLPTYCFALMQNVSKDEQERFAQQVTAISNINSPDEIKFHSTRPR